MTQLEYWRILAIQAAAAGPYQVVGRCYYCAADEALASFQPLAFGARVACCRRCREARTGVPDTRGLIHGSAAVSRPPELPTPVVIRGLLPAVCDSSRPVNDDGWARRPQYSAADLDAIFAPLTIKERLEAYGDAGPAGEILALSDLDQQLDAMIAELDRRDAEGAFVPTGFSSSTDPAATASETPALTPEILADLKAKYARCKLRIVADCPIFPPDRAFEWERRGVMFLGSEVVEALAREAERIDGFSRVIGRPLQTGERKMFGVEVEPWGSKDDHIALAVELARELDPS